MVWTKNLVLSQAIASAPDLYIHARIVSKALPPVHEEIQSRSSAPPSFVLQLLLCPDSCMVKSCAFTIGVLATSDSVSMVVAY